MQCSRCQHENPSALKYCGECGARLAAVCASCGAANAPEQKFCGECGRTLSPDSAKAKLASPDSYTPKHLAERILTSKSALEGERKQVTVLFADLKGSMELLADRDPEEARKILDHLTKASKQSYFPPYLFGAIHVALGENEQGLAWLEEAYTHRDPYMVHLKRDAAFDPLRSDPRFQDLLRRVGFPQ